MVLSYKERSQKLRTVSESFGYDHPITLLHAHLNAAIIPGICTNAKCNFIVGVEPQEEYGHCVNCDTYTVQSIFILAGVA